MKTMAEVLEEVDAKWCSEVGCATSAEWAEYMAAALSAAGFGPVREAQAQALRDAADDMDEVIACGDVAEVAAPVEGSVGRPEAISARDSLYEEPSHWLRGYADAVEDAIELEGVGQ